jgi:hypothetical protein
MHYCITEGDIDMVINKWVDEWRVPAITHEIIERTSEEEEEKGEQSLHKSKCPRDQEWSKVIQHRQMKGQRR